MLTRLTGEGISSILFQISRKKNGVIFLGRILVSWPDIRRLRVDRILSCVHSIFLSDDIKCHGNILPVFLPWINDKTRRFTTHLNKFLPHFFLWELTNQRRHNANGPKRSSWLVFRVSITELIGRYANRASRLNLLISRLMDARNWSQIMLNVTKPKKKNSSPGHRNRTNCHERMNSSFVKHH